MAAEALRAALVGAGISMSLTPAMHEAEGRAQGLDYTYAIIDTGAAGHAGRALLDIVETAQADGYLGLNITHPYKIEIVQHLDKLSAVAAQLGAVNTVVFEAGKRVGHNTDFLGFTTSFRTQLGDAPKDCVLLLGAGGAGAAVGFALAACGVDELLIYDRCGDQATALVDRLAGSQTAMTARAVENLENIKADAVSGVVNATPMGMAAHPGTALPLALLSGDMWVVDIIYFPQQTALLAAAQGLGCRIMSGNGMAISQAVHAFELFTGQRADPIRMAESFKRLRLAP